MYYIILNPISKSGQGIPIWKKLKPVFTERNIPYKLLRSKYAGHISELIRKIMDNLQDDGTTANVILLGGDGTLNEALQGVTDFSRINFGYIPTGSSNDFARDLKLPADPREILELILSRQESGQIRLLDLGVLEYSDLPAAQKTASQNLSQTRYFVVSSGIGFDAAVCEEALSSPLKNALNKLKLGKLTYLGVALKQLIQANSVSCELMLDDQQTIRLPRFLFIASMLHQYEGGGFKFAPGADSTDGLLDLCVVGNVPKALIFFALPTAFFGKHYIFPRIDAYTAQKVEIRTSAPLWVHTDGEVHTKSGHIIVSCQRQKIRFLL